MTNPRKNMPFTYKHINPVARIRKEANYRSEQLLRQMERRLPQQTYVWPIPQLLHIMHEQYLINLTYVKNSQDGQI